MLTAIIVAGGSSRRMGFDKTFALLIDKSVVAHSIAAFEAAECVAEIIVVGREDRLSELRAVAVEQRFSKVQHIVAGGAQRQDSVQSGLRLLGADCSYVAVHDAARPLVTPAQIGRVYEAVRAHGAASLAAPVTETLKRADAEGFIYQSLDRAEVYAMQTPQIFSRELLQRAYGVVGAENLAITDDVSAVQHLGCRVLLVPADDLNLKITFPSDLVLAGLVLCEREKLK